MSVSLPVLGKSKTDVLAVNETFGPTVQGEGISAGVPAYFVRLNGCDLHCSFCFVPDTLVLLADWRWKRLGDLRVGDEVLAQERDTEAGAHARIVKATVLHLSSKYAETVRINGDRSLRCTPDHKFWEVRRQDTKVGGNRWREVENCLGSKARFLAKPHKEENEDFLRGWLAGMADGDGCFWTLRKKATATRTAKFYKRFRLAVRDEELLDEFGTLLVNFGFLSSYRRIHNAGINNKFGDPLIPCLYVTKSQEAQKLQDFLDNSEREVRDLKSWSHGYLAGIFDAAGSGGLKISQSKKANPVVYRRVEACLIRTKFSYTKSRLGFRISSAGGALWKFYSRCRPRRHRLLEASIGRTAYHSRTIKSIEPTGVREQVITVTTSEGSFIAGGFVVKNCDTPQTWKKGVLEPSTPISAEDLMTEILRATMATPTRARTIVITGGEPLLQQRRPAFLRLLQLAKQNSFRIEVETAGHHVPEKYIREYVDQWNISPKLAASGNEFLDYEESLKYFHPHVEHHKPRVALGTVHQFNAYLKFVVGVGDYPDYEAEFAAVDAVVDSVDWPHDRVIIMPEGITVEAITSKALALVNPVIARGYRLGTRLHILIWGNKRAV